MYSLNSGMVHNIILKVYIVLTVLKKWISKEVYDLNNLKNKAHLLIHGHILIS